MLKRTAIRALCNTTAYQRGLDIYRTGKRIQSLDIKSEGAVDKISAAVKGSGRNVYNTGFQYDTEADRIKEAYCDCPAFRSYSGICKHCVAVLLEYGDRKAYERVEIRRQQDEEQKQAELFSGTAFPVALSGPGPAPVLYPILPDRHPPDHTGGIPDHHRGRAGHLPHHRQENGAAAGAAALRLRNDHSVQQGRGHPGKGDLFGQKSAAGVRPHHRLHQ